MSGSLQVAGELDELKQLLLTMSGLVQDRLTTALHGLVERNDTLLALRINADLERAGALARRIAEAAQRYLAHPPVKPLIDVPRMGQLALTMLREALQAFVGRDAGCARSVLRDDEWMDALRNQVVRELLTFMLSDPRTIEPALELILISNHLERIGDHATNIAEDVVFVVEARDIRHGSRRREEESAVSVTRRSAERRRPFTSPPV